MANSTAVDPIRRRMNAGKRLAAQDALETTVLATAGLLEALAELLQMSVTPDGLTLSREAIQGLHALAIEQGETLRKRMNEMGH